MPVHCELRDGKHRIVEPSGKIAETEDGNPRDDGGHATEAECQRHANAINAGEHQSADEKDLIRFATTEPVGTIERAKGIIHGVSIITKGEAEGHRQFIDEVMLDQVNEAGQLKEPVGLKSRFDHPNACSRAIGTYTGRFHNFRRDSNNVRADLHLANVADKAPDGKLRAYILDLAEEDPEAFATSIIFRLDEPAIMDSANKGKPGYPPDGDPYWYPHVRLKALHHCDVVDQGAANEGLFGNPEYWTEQAEKWAREHPNVIGSILATFYEWKQKREEKKMSDQQKQEHETELAAAIERATTAETALTASKEKVKELEKDIEPKTSEAYDEGFAAGAVVLKARLEKYKDPAFVAETVELADEEVKDKYIARLESKAQKGGGETPVEFSTGGEGGSGTQEKFEDKVAEKEQEEGISHGAAVAFCARNFPKLHKEYIERTNKDRSASDD